MIALVLAAALSIPDIIDYDPARGATTPLWVRDSAAFTSDGRLRRELFNEAAETLLNASAHDGDDCRAVWVQMCHEGNPPRVDDAIAIVTGRVVERAYGFAAGSGSTLVRIKVETVEKASPQVDTSDGLLVLFEHATFRVAGRTFCTDSSVGTLPPTLGARVTIYVRRPPIDAHHQLVAPTYPPEVVVLK